MKIWIHSVSTLLADRTVMRLAVVSEPPDTWSFHGYYGDLL